MGLNYLVHLYANFSSNYLYIIFNSQFWESMDVADQLYAMTHATL